ncbi:MAG: glycogen debranching protein GlgX [Actinomycetota bacterium]
MEQWPGIPYPLGATWDGKGTNFALFSENATGVELCLFDERERVGRVRGEEGDEEGAETRLALTEIDSFVWHCYLPGIGPGRRYGYRIDGPFAPEKGHRFNRNKLLLDPYAKSLEGNVDWSEEVFGYNFGSGEDADLTFNEADSAPSVPKSVVIDPTFDWEGDEPLSTPWHRTVIYETHVKGFTYTNPGIPKEIRGTYAGLAHPASIEHLQLLGITAVELMPVHHFLHPRFLIDKGLSNYWGYDSIGYFAPYAGYSASGRAEREGREGGPKGQQVAEFKYMVKELHSAGIEVILDVVYNHTGEGNHMGPTVSFRGIDNAAYYRLVDRDKRFNMDFTGTGNSLNVRHPQILKLIMDSLRYWAIEMHVDGFRFDLASALARELYEVDRLSAFFDIIHQDPVLSQVKLIAEPWDVGEGGYQVGNFPPGWSEWNGKYRDSMRDFWRGAEAGVGEFAFRLTGSSDLYEDDGRRPNASINFITAHDGFTLNDLVSYNQKHNEANGENNKDGESHNRSWNHGIEGETDDPAIRALRQRQMRNFLVTLALSQGVPMFLSGDEMGRTQGGNNNAYCQDNETGWIDWSLRDENFTLLGFVRRLMQFRRDHPVLRRHRWFMGRAIHGEHTTDIAWLNPGGDEMTEQQWNDGFAKSIGVFLNGDEIATPGPRGERITDDSFLLFFNAHHEPMDFIVPPGGWGRAWNVVIDTNEPLLDEGVRSYKAGDAIALEARSLVVLRRTD